MKHWPVAYIILGFAILPQAYWGALFVAAAVMPILSAGTWPIHSLVESTLLIASISVVTAAFSLLISGILLRHRGFSSVGISLGVVGSAFYWVFVVGRFLATHVLGAHLSPLFYMQSILIGSVAIVATAKIVFGRTVSQKAQQ